MTRDDIKELKKGQSFPSLTIFIPLHIGIAQRTHDDAQIKDLVRKSLEDLAKIAKPEELEILLGPLNNLIKDIDFTKLQKALAIFISKNVAKSFNLPFEVESKIYIANHFATKELLQAIDKNPYYWVLSVSYEPTRLFLGVGDYVHEIIDTKEDRILERGFPFELPYEVTSDRKKQAVDTGGLDSRYFDDRLKKFFQEIDQLLNSYLTDEHMPLILIGTEKNLAFFQEITKHTKNIIGTHKGDASHLNNQEIAKLAKDVLDKYLASEAQAAVKIFKEVIGTPQHSFGLKNVWHRADEGRVRILLIEENLQDSGIVIDSGNQSSVMETARKTPHDLVDDLIDLVLSKRGKVIFVKPDSLKEFEHVGAILRY